MDNILDNYKIIRQNSDLLNILRFNQFIDKNELSRRLNLSLPTVYKLLQELNKNEIITKENGEFFINKNYGSILGISLGTSLCKVILLDMNFDLFEKDDFHPYKKYFEQHLGNLIDATCITADSEEKNYFNFKTPETFLELKNALDVIFCCVQHFIELGQLNLLSIGISCTGVINSQANTILDAHNLSYLNELTLDNLIDPQKKVFFNQKNIDLYLTQNGNACVISEKIHLNKTNSPYKDRKNIISIYLGVGIGAGIYFNGLYSGTSGYAGEVGHIKAYTQEGEKDRIDANAILDKECSCGDCDCYDYKIRSYVFEKNKENFCNMTSASIREYLEQNDSKCRLLGTYLGDLINTLTKLLNVDLIIMTGKFYKSMDLLNDYITEVQDQNKLKFSRRDCVVLSSDYGPLSPSIGAAIYAYHKKFGLELSWDY